MPSSHHKRILTSLLLIPILLSCLLTGGWFLFGLILVTTLLGLREFYGIFWKRGTHEVYKFTGYTAATALLLAGEYGAYDWMLYILAGTFWAASLVFLLRYGQHNDTICFTDTQVLTLGLFYLPVGLHFSFTLQPYELLLIICAAFASDTGGYYMGTYYGKHRIWPRISPKKSWEGSLGGLALCLVTCVIGGRVFGNPQTPVWLWVLLGIWLNLTAQLGDFFESALKRRLGVKDSGRMLPGHGGLLDRIDSLLLALPAYAAARSIEPFFI